MSEFSDLQKPVKTNKLATAPILPLLLKMAIPAICSMIISSLYNIVDSIFVAKVSPNALAAVSLVFPFQVLIIGFALGTAVGLNSFIARSIGKKEYDSANKASNHIISIGILAGIAFAVIGGISAQFFYSNFTDNLEIIDLSRQYSVIVTTFAFAVIMQLSTERTLQATGNMLVAMISGIVGAIINICLDPILIFGFFGVPAMGVKGAAIATVTGQCFGMCTALTILLCKKHIIDVDVNGNNIYLQTKISHTILNIKIIKEIYKVGIPVMFMQSIASVMIMCLNVILIGFSPYAVSVLGIYYKLQTFVFMPVWGINQGTMPILGYNYGAKNYKRMFEALKTAIMCALCVMVVGTLIFMIFPHLLVSLFSSPPEMTVIAVPALRIISIAFLPCVISLLISTFFQAMGNGKISLFISAIRQLVLILPVAYFLSSIIGVTGVWIAFPVAEFVSMGLSLFLFFRIKSELNGIV